jgi:hypothetical protein
VALIGQTPAQQVEQWHRKQSVLGTRHRSPSCGDDAREDASRPFGIAVGESIPGIWDFRLHYGSVSARRQGSRVHIRVFADDDTNLSYVKMEVAACANEILGSTGGICWSGQGNLPALPVFFRQITVVSSQRISPHMQRIRFRSDNLSRYANGGIHIRLLIPPSGREAVWPSIGPVDWLSGRMTRMR